MVQWQKKEVLHLCEIGDWVLCLDENNKNILFAHKGGLRSIGQNEFGLVYDYIRSLQQFLDGDVESLLLYLLIDAQMDEIERAVIEEKISDGLKKMDVIFLLLHTGVPRKYKDE